MLTLFVALVSPIDPFSDLLLSVHMVQHLLLMVLAPVLFAAASPGLALAHGLPRVLRPAAKAVLTSGVARSARAAATLPVRLGVLTLVSWLWHVPGLYELTLRSQRFHYLEHGAFFAAALLFWWPVVAPSRSPDRAARWWLIPYLMVAAIQGTALSSFITFAPRVIYPHYARVAHVLGVSALDDQATAGALLWVFGCVAYVVAAVSLVPSLLRSRRPTRRRRLPVLGGRREAPEGDLLAGPLGRLLRHRDARFGLQLVMLVLAVLVVADGLIGPRVAPLNAAGVLPWIYWRGLVVIALLLVGNVVCMACPFTLSRALVRRLPIRRRRWPRALRNKWPAVLLLVLFLWAYEALSLWSSPFWTAWIVVGYFVASATVDAFFEGAAFCKHVCPIGQFNFVWSLVSPREVRARETSVCESCETHECVRGSEQSPGCEMALFQPLKSGNMDCTFCLDCVQACPHDNVTVMAVTPGLDLLRDPRRAGVGRFRDRWDTTALVLVLVFGGLVNAVAMVEPALVLEDRWSAALGSPPWVVVAVEIALGVILAPLVSVTVSVWLTRRFGGVRGSTRAVAADFARTLVPLGLGLWAAHTAFHFLTGLDAARPVIARLSAGAISAQCAMCSGAAPWVLHVELVLLQLGLLGTLYAAYRVGLRRAPAGRAFWAAGPWCALALALYGVGLWTLFQPMAMRGMM